MFFGIGQSLAFWSEPDHTAPNSTTAQPIIAGNPADPLTQAIQSKEGLLIVQGALDIQSAITTTTLNVNSDITVQNQLCLNDECVSSWGTLIGDYVHLDPLIAQLGTVEITSIAASPDANSRALPLASWFGVRATADQPIGDSTAGIVGESYNAEDAEATIGVAGLATDAAYCVGGGDAGERCVDGSTCDNLNCAPNNLTRGVWGSDGGFANAWAGRYEGRVGVEGDLCINDDCRNSSNWGPIEDESLVKVQNSNSPTFQIGEVRVEGSAKTGQFVVGEPLPTTPVFITCGDNLCNYGNNGESPVTCPADCS